MRDPPAWIMEWQCEGTAIYVLNTALRHLENGVMAPRDLNFGTS